MTGPAGDREPEAGAGELEPAGVPEMALDAEAQAPMEEDPAAPEQDVAPLDGEETADDERPATAAAAAGGPRATLVPVLLIAIGALSLLAAIVSAIIAAGIGGGLQQYVGAVPTPGDVRTGNAIASGMSGIAVASGLAVLFGAAGLAALAGGIGWLIWRRRVPAS